MNPFRKLAEKSWATHGPLEELPEPSVAAAAAAKTGLGFFLAVVSSLFFLFVMAYQMRMAEPDWQSVTLPGILWLNTALLIAASIAFQWAKSASANGSLSKLRTGLIVAGLLSIAFLLGQLLGWQSLNKAGFFAATNPANAFFYLLTGIHGLHLLGGLWALIRSVLRAWSSSASEDLETARKLRVSVGLCTTYWHYLLLVWFVILTLFIVT